MILVTSPSSVIESILTGFKATRIPLPDNEDEFRLAYRSYLKSVHGSCPWLRDPGQPIIEIVTSDARRKELTQFWQRESDLNDSDQTNIIRAESVDLSKYKIVSDAIEALNSVSPLHAEIFHMVIEKVFCAPAEEAIGGSTSDAIGLIWTNAVEGFDTTDYVELLVHELTHNLLFLDECVNPHYDYGEILKRELWCRSAIRKIDRPLDKVFHAVVVAAEVVLLREQVTGEPENPKIHPPSPQIREGIVTSIQELRELPVQDNIIYSRVWELVDLIESKLQLGRSCEARVAPSLVAA